MEKNIIIIDDDKNQAESLSKALAKELPEFSFEYFHEEAAILDAIENRFFSLAIVDIRMDKYHINGIDITKRIFEMNPFSKVLIISAFKDEYLPVLKEVLLSGKVIDIMDKEKFEVWIPKLKSKIVEYYKVIDQNPSEINKALLQFYADAKNEPDTYKKGQRFEHFISLLFQSFGYKEISKRTKDKSLNEVDLIIRNEIDDEFLNKFGKYILIECKNKPEAAVSKNDFILFHSKLVHTSGLAELGILATTGYISWNTYYEALRTSGDGKKVMFISNPEIERLINANDKKEEFKRLIDAQVKDN